MPLPEAMARRSRGPSSGKAAAARKTQIPILRSKPAVPPPGFVPTSAVPPDPAAVPDTLPRANVLRAAYLVPAAAAGLLFGGLAALLLSACKPTVGLLNLVVALALAGVLLVGLLGLSGLVCLLESFVSGRLATALSRLRGWMGIGLLAGTVSFVVGALLVGAEAVGPSEGYVKRMLDRTEQRQQQSDQEARKAEKEKWSEADFILAVPGHRALAIRNDGEGNLLHYTVLARAADEQTREPLTQAWNAHIPVLANDPALTRRLAERYGPGQTLDNADAFALYRLARYRPLVPTEAPRVLFVEAASKQRRVGHLLKDTGKGFVFCDLIPRANLAAGGESSAPEELFQTETISRAEQVEPDSEVKLANDRQLRQSADFLDYCLYSMLTRLPAGQGSHDRVALRPCLLVDDVRVEHSLQDQVLAHLKDQLRDLQADKRAALAGMLDRDESRWQDSTGLAALLRVLTDSLREREHDLTTRTIAENVRREYAEEVRALKEEIDVVSGLLATDRQLNRDIRRLLVQAGVVLVDRSEEARGLYGKVDGKGWVRASADGAVPEGLLQATHLLLTEITRPQATGNYHLAMRLVEVRTGEILWMDDGDRTLLPK